LSSSGSKYRSILATKRPDEVYARFYVYPDGITSFRVARTIAGERGFSVGWTLYGKDEGMRFCVANCSGGIPPTVQ
jgi:hypothetical protein